MRKWILFGLGGALGLITLISAVILSLNAFDPPLRPEVEKILAQIPEFSDQQKQAYFHVLGFTSGAVENFAAKGAELWEQRATPGFWENLAKRRVWQNDFSGCGAEVCTVKSLEDDPARAEKLKQYHDAIEAYVQLMAYGEGCTLFTGDRNTLLVSISGMPYAMHRLFLLQLAQWLRHGGEARVFDLLADSNHFMHSYLQNGNLLERSVALMNLLANAKFLQAELQRDSHLRISQDLVESFAAPDVDRMLGGAIEQELRVFDNVVHGLTRLSDFELSSSGDPENQSHLKDHIPTRILLRPNETLNQYYEIARQILNSDCAGDQELEQCVPAAVWMGFHYPWDYAINPIGRSLVRIMMANGPNRRPRLKKRVEEFLQIKEQFRSRMNFAGM